MIDYSVNSWIIVSLTVCFIILIFLTEWWFMQVFAFPYEPGATISSIFLGLLVFGMGILFIKGFFPFLHGLRLPGKAFLMIWPLCAILAIPQIGRFEITGNIFIDVIIIGLFIVTSASIITAGCIYLVNNKVIDKGLITVWLIGSFFLAVLIRIIIWTIE